jgi:hypothetical protein
MTHSADYRTAQRVTRSQRTPVIRRYFLHVSWDLFALALPKDAQTIDDIPQDWAVAPIGHRDHLITEILRVVPEADFSDPTWGLVDGADYSIEISMGRKENVEGITFHVRGADGAIAVVAAILDRLQLKAVDTQSRDGALFTPESAAASLEDWRRYRDSALSRVDPPEVPN